MKNYSFFKEYFLTWNLDNFIVDSGYSDSDSEVIITETYLAEANQFIQNKCTQTAVSFIYLPKPPAQVKSHSSYLENLETLTRGLPPSILVHGVSPVISTTL